MKKIAKTLIAVGTAAAVGTGAFGEEEITNRDMVVDTNQPVYEESYEEQPDKPDSEQPKDVIPEEESVKDPEVKTPEKPEEDQPKVEQPEEPKEKTPEDPKVEEPTPEKPEVEEKVVIEIVDKGTDPKENEDPTPEEVEETPEEIEEIPEVPERPEEKTEGPKTKEVEKEKEIVVETVEEEVVEDDSIFKQIINKLPGRPSKKTAGPQAKTGIASLKAVAGLAGSAFSFLFVSNKKKHAKNRKNK